MDGDQEGLAYQLDAVTIYSGYNNTRGLGQDATLKNWSRNWLLINFIRVATQQTLRSSESLLRREKETRTRAFVAGLDRILEAAHQQDIAPCSQPMFTSPRLPTSCWRWPLLTALPGSSAARSWDLAELDFASVFGLGFNATTRYLDGTGPRPGLSQVVS